MFIARLGDGLILADEYIQRRNSGEINTFSQPQDPLTGERVNAVTQTEVSRGGKMHLRRAHWRALCRGEQFVLDDVLPDSDYFRVVDGGVVRKKGGESWQHKLWKATIYEKLLSQAPERPGRAELTFEYPVKMKVPGYSQKKRRICDIAEVYKNGNVHSYEVQLSSISPKDLEERTEDYLENGCDVAWFLGGKADTPLNREWHYDYFGQHAKILNIKDEACPEVSVIEMS
jgi:hypothetical protein